MRTNEREYYMRNIKNLYMTNDQHDGQLES